ncbi:MAG TPA: AarF/UbiB family protein [Acidimicrobiales bacterium]|nr:AarF/UbiB family protein [Acidimicrobiales bacterium]
MTVPTSAAPDLQVGSFSDRGPWSIIPDELAWRGGIAARRTRTRAEVPHLLRRRRLPPGSRVASVGLRLGWAVVAWYVRDRRRGPRQSRQGLSRRLRLAFEALGPTYIKLGQILSSGQGIFPEELVAEFRLCRDHVPAEPFPLVRGIIEADLGQPLEAVFAHVDPQPVAAASIAQVHPARLVTGEEVVVKVQRPQVASLVRRDLAAMAWLAPSLVGRIPITSLANPPALVELFAETIVEELDFRLEAENMLDLARVLAETGTRTTIVPRPHPRLVTRRVLTMERLEGFSWDDASGMRAAGIDTTAVLRDGMVGFLEGAMLYGVFHGDLHGGNLFVQPDGRVVLLDFGITGRLEEPRRLAFLRLLMGGTINDVRLQVSALRELGALPADADTDAVIRDLDLEGPVQDPTRMTAEELTAQIRDLTKALLSYGARMPKELMLFVKNLLFLDAAIANLAPDLDLFAEVVRLAEYFATRYGDRIAADVGLDPRQATVDLDGLRASMGLTPEVEGITYRELQARRETIRRRMEERDQRRRRRRWRLPRRRRG